MRCSPYHVQLNVQSQSGKFILGGWREGLSSNTNYYPHMLKSQAYKNEETKLSVMGGPGKQQESLIPQTKELKKPKIGYHVAWSQQIRSVYKRHGAGWDAIS